MESRHLISQFSLSSEACFIGFSYFNHFLLIIFVMFWDLVKYKYGLNFNVNMLKPCNERHKHIERNLEAQFLMN